MTKYVLSEFDELTLAKLMSEGRVPSPQRYHNMTLFSIRITGTGVAYRPQLNEYVYRKEENYLTDEFLQRCNGLPVIWNHPKDSLLNSDEFEDRIVGTVFLPYIKDNEVWAVAKIYDDDAIKLLETEQWSTSPAVLLSKSTKRKLEDGSNLLVEEKPTLLDHICICKAGVWDKGEEPSGVSSTLERSDSFSVPKPIKYPDLNRVLHTLQTIQISTNMMKYRINRH